MSVCYSELGAREFRAAIGDLVAVYAAAMNPPERLIGGREAIMDRHAASPGFRCLTAVDDGVVAGFCYGFHGESGQWWHDMVASALASRSGAGYAAPAPESPEAADQSMFAPIAVTWTSPANRPGCGGPTGPSCGTETTRSVLAVPDGVGQAVGSLFIIGVFPQPNADARTTTLTRDSLKPVFRLTPASVGSGYGMEALTTF